MTRSRIIVLVCILALLTGALACSSKGRTRGSTGVADPPFRGAVPEDAYVTDASVGSYGGTLVMAIPSNPKSFNPIVSVETSTAWVINNVVFKALTDYDNEQQKDIPGVAKSWEASPDGLEWTFHLRKGLLWSDGAPFTADDVMFTFQVMFDPNIAASARDLLIQSDKTLPVVEKVDDYTIRFRLKEPNALFVAALNNAFPLPKHKWEKAYKDGQFEQTLQLSSNPEDIVCLGPYCISEFVPDQRVVLVRNPYYWKVDQKGQRLPYIDKIIFLIVPTFDTMALKFGNGDTDMIHDINPDAVEMMKRGETSGNYTLYELPGFNTTYLVFNQDTGVDKKGRPYVDPVKLGWFRNKKFRQAISYAIDREGLVRTTLFGHGSPIYSFDPPANKLWYCDNAAKYPYDPGKALALLSEIGLNRNGSGQLVDSNGRAVEFNLTTNASRASRVNTGTLIKDDLAKIGIGVNFQPGDYNLIVDKLRRSRDFDAVIGSWQSGVPPDPIEAKNVLLPGSNDYYAFPNQKAPSTEWEKRFTDLISVCSSTIDMNLRRKSYCEAMEIWSEYLPEIDLIVANYAIAAKNNIGNVKPSSLANYTYWNIEELFFKK